MLTKNNLTLILSLVGLLVLLVFVPPSHPVFVLLFVLDASLLTYLTATYITPQKKYQIIPAVGVFLFLIINYLAGFQLLNIILLISFIIGLVVLLS